MIALERYQDNLKNPRTRGTGCHSWIMSTVNLGIMAGKDPQVIQVEILQANPYGIRHGEIEEAINKVLGEQQTGTYIPRSKPAPAVNDGKAALHKILEQGKYIDEVDIWEASPRRIWDEPKDHPCLLLSVLYSPDDLVFIGELYGEGILGNTIRPVSEWTRYFKDGGKTGPHIIPNPLTGTPGPKKSGDGETLRGDLTVKEYRYCVVEFDDLSRGDQLRFWSAVRLPIVSLIDSGGKSIHAWLQVSRIARVRTLEEWDEQIKCRLYEKLLIPLGVDPACKNTSRLSRLPGHFREEKGSWQRLLWLSGEGKKI